MSALTPDEDAHLRRLHWFERFGVTLAPEMRALKLTIRSRDKRSSIREPHTSDGAVQSERR